MSFNGITYFSVSSVPALCMNQAVRREKFGDIFLESIAGATSHCYYSSPFNNTFNESDPAQ